MRVSKEQVLLLCVLLPILYRQNKKGRPKPTLLFIFIWMQLEGCEQRAPLSINACSWLEDCSPKIKGAAEATPLSLMSEGPHEMGEQRTI
jgi:hypothetical protein